MSRLPGRPGTRPRRPNGATAAGKRPSARTSASSGTASSGARPTSTSAASGSTAAPSAKPASAKPAAKPAAKPGAKVTSSKPASPGRASSAARFADRARLVRWRSRRRVLLWAIAAVAVVVLGAVLWTGPVLLVRSVAVQARGGPALTAEQTAQVRERAQVPMRRPLARVDTEAVARRAEQLPYVADVTVARGWPSTLRLQVRLRVPVAAVPTPKGVRLVDEEGVAYALVANAPAGVPVVSVELGGSQGSAALDAALSVLSQLPDPLRESVKQVRATSPDAVRLRVDGADVVWGSADRTPRKAQIYAALRAVPAKVYDVSSPDTPVTR